LAEPRLRAARPADLPAILSLNQANEAATSPLDAASLARLAAAAFACLVVDGGATAVMIALDQNADYASANYQWFRARYPRFIYIDRMIVAEQARGQGWAQLAYRALFASMAAAGQPLAACEVNLHPPNPASDAFHAALGFTECGRARLAGGKTVRYLTATPCGAGTCRGDGP
jgi:predicted GNAT superfamily acetyltransferase